MCREICLLSGCQNNRIVVLVPDPLYWRHAMINRTDFSNDVKLKWLTHTLQEFIQRETCLLLQGPTVDRIVVNGKSSTWWKLPCDILCHTPSLCNADSNHDFQMQHQGATTPTDYNTVSIWTSINTSCRWNSVYISSSLVWLTPINYTMTAGVF